MASTIADESDYYRMDYPHRGRALIINNQVFKESLHLNSRRGSEIDARKMGKILHKLQFDVQIFHNLQCQEMMSLLEKAGRVSHADHDCFACVLLSHGEEGVIYGTDGRVRIADLLEPLKGHRCPSLAGKPKLFFIQACRGDRLDPGVETTDGGDAVDAAPQLHRIPTEADFLIAYSVVPGFFSWRNCSQGSWFIQALAEALDEFGSSRDLLSVLTKVNRRVALDFESRASDPVMCRRKQVPSMVSMLTRLVFFRPK